MQGSVGSKSSLDQFHVGKQDKSCMLLNHTCKETHDARLQKANTEEGGMRIVVLLMWAQTKLRSRSCLLPVSFEIDWLRRLSPNPCIECGMP